MYHPAWLTRCLLVWQYREFIHLYFHFDAFYLPSYSSFNLSSLRTKTRRKLHLLNFCNAFCLLDHSLTYIERRYYNFLWILIFCLHHSQARGT
jgi:hypothetical protein